MPIARGSFTFLRGLSFSRIFNKSFALFRRFGKSNGTHVTVAHRLWLTERISTHPHQMGYTAEQPLLA